MIAAAPAERCSPGTRRRVWTDRSEGRWFDMVEAEIGVLRGRCLDRRNDDARRLVSGEQMCRSERRQAEAALRFNC